MSDQDVIQPGQEETLDISAEGIKIKTGFGLDIGGSMAKVVYATDEGSKIRFHFVSYPPKDVEKIVTLLKEKLGGKLEPGSTVYTCGVGVQNISETINKELNVKIYNTSEMDCFCRAFWHLSSTAPAEDIFHPVSTAVKENTMKLLQQLQVTFKAFEEGGADHKKWDVLEDKKEDEDSKDDTTKPEGQPKQASGEKEKEAVAGEASPEAFLKFPVLLCALGSGGAFMKVDEDGSHMLMEGSTRCGRTFVGLGKILTGAKDFSELVNLASKGDFEKLHILGKHMKSDNADDMYSKICDDMMMYSFGHAMNKSPDAFSREDLAAAWVNFLASDLAQSIHLTAMAADTPTICMCGGLVGLSQLVRDQISVWMDFRCTVNFKSIQYDYKFLRMGGYYGALGALLKSMGIDRK